MQLTGEHNRCGCAEVVDSFHLAIAGEEIIRQDDLGLQDVHGGAIVATPRECRCKEAEDRGKEAGLFRADLRIGGRLRSGKVDSVEKERDMAGITGVWRRGHLLKEARYVEEETVSRGIVEEIAESIIIQHETKIVNFVEHTGCAKSDCVVAKARHFRLVTYGTIRTDQTR